MAIHPIFMLVVLNFLFFSKYSFATDTITQLESLPDGKTLVSEDGIFELGFFNPGTSPNRYVGIWYKNIPQRIVVWVANRDNSIKDNSSMLSISTNKNLVLLNQNNTVLWSTNTTIKDSNIVAQLLNSGNLVLRNEKDNNPQNYLWQSFDYPSDTLLPGMKLGWNFKTGLNRRLTAWKNWDDPSPGDFTWGLVHTNNPEAVMWKGSTVYFRTGPSMGMRFSGGSSFVSNSVFNYSTYTFVFNKDELYISFGLIGKSVILREVLNQTGYDIERLTWNNDTQTWTMNSQAPRDYCDNYNICGPFGICSIGESPICKCLNGFEPKSLQNWNQGEWTQGCVHNENWSCKEKNKDGFLKFSNMKAPDTTRSWLNESMTLKECEAKCRENCSCTAFANSDVKGQGSGCSIWFDDLLDLKQISNGEQDIYIRLAVPKTENQDAKGDSKKKVVVVTSTVSSIFVVLLIFALIYWKRKSRNGGTLKWREEENIYNKQEDLEVSVFDLALIKHVTNDFSSYNKLGEGGFGPVYKGILPDGQEIAVKRLSQTSRQGFEEFKNEVVLCAKLQHRNLVKVLGCCIQKDEKMLIYEFMANKSLDYFLFDSDQSRFLNWPVRFYIICGIARGLLYLHQDSRLRIIHRDLKTSNILLDNEMNPKISDFGLARMCGGDQIEGNTSRVIGTYGYMAPEYAFDGLFSIKSDVFSFGVLLLEIVSGKKSTGLFGSNHKRNLIGHAWGLWKEGMITQFIDACLEDSYVPFEALRCVHIGLLCVQHHPNDRPNMAAVVVMLSSESILPQPKEPSFLVEKASIEGDHHFNYQTSSSVNEVTISILNAR